MTELADLVREDGSIDARMIAAGDQDNLTADATVSTSTCAAIRRAADDGETFRDIGDRLDLSTSSVRYHAYGECTHDVATDPIDQRLSPVSRETCAKLQRDAERLGSNRAAALENGVSPRTAIRHTRGECSHDHDHDRDDDAGADR